LQSRERRDLVFGRRYFRNIPLPLHHAGGDRPYDHESIPPHLTVNRARLCRALRADKKAALAALLMRH
jgi:hypothetical protein